jgi:hypothetical protein
VAREVIEKVTDDLDGTEAVETVSFGFDGTSYEIDLSKKNAATLRKSLDRYVQAGRRSSSATRPARSARQPTASRRRPTSKRNYDIARLREWAGANSIAVPSRGRIPQTVVDQYRAAGGR